VCVGAVLANKIGERTERDERSDRDEKLHSVLRSTDRTEPVRRL
jgi:hypothetical protein